MCSQLMGWTLSWGRAGMDWNGGAPDSTLAWTNFSLKRIRQPGKNNMLQYDVCLYNVVCNVESAVVDTNYGNSWNAVCPKGISMSLASTQFSRNPKMLPRHWCLGNMRWQLCRTSRVSHLHVVEMLRDQQPTESQSPQLQRTLLHGFENSAACRLHNFERCMKTDWTQYMLCSNTFLRNQRRQHGSGQNALAAQKN